MDAELEILVQHVKRENEEIFRFLMDIRENGINLIPYVLPTGCRDKFLDHQKVEFMTHITRGGEYLGSASLSKQGTGKTKPCLHALDWFMTERRERNEWIETWVAEAEQEHEATVVEMVGKRLKQLPVLDACLVVSPNSVVYKWESEVRDNIPHRRACVLQGSSRQRKAKLFSSADIYIINYEGLLVLEDDFVEWIKEGEIAIVLDEAHWIKNPTARRTEVLWRKLCDVRKKIILTGTIKPNNIYDIHPSLTWLAPSLLNDQPRKEDGRRYSMNTLFDRFCTKYLIRKNTFYFYVPKWTIEEMRTKLQSVSVQYEKKECLDLPEQIFTWRGFELTTEQEKIYRDAEKHFVVWLTGLTQEKEPLVLRNVLVRLLRLRQIAGGYVSVEDAIHEFMPNRRMAALLEAVEEIDENEKVVICAPFVYENFAIYHRLCEKYGKDATLTFYNGNDDIKLFRPVPVSDGKRQKLCEKFQDDKSVRFVVTSQSLTAEGINLQAASYMIRYARSFNFVHEDHFANRIHRIGQLKKCTYIDLKMLAPTGVKLNIDEIIEENLNKKEELLASLCRRIGVERSKYEKGNGI